jgi:outer membrane protein assembly factor BamB
MTSEKIAKATRASLIALIVIFSFGAAGEICGSFFETTAAAFGSKFPDNKPEDVKSVVSGLDAPQPVGGVGNSMGIPVAILVIEEDPRAIVAIDLNSGNEIWKITPPVSSQITLKGDLLVFQSGIKIAGYSLVTGQELWDLAIDEGWNYHGADIYGDTAVVSVGVGGEEAGAYANGRILGINAKNGHKRWDNSSGGGLVGAAAIYGKYVFVPWDRQKIVVLDAKEGKEICRLRADDYTINFVEACQSGVYFGSAATGTSLSSIFRFDEKAATGTRVGSTMFVPNLEPVPGDPWFKNDAFGRPVAGRSASEKIRFHWLPTIDGTSPIAMSDSVFYLHYWRYVVALDSTTSRVRWTYRSDQDIESMRPLPGGVIGVDSNGRMFFLDATSGTEIWSKETGHKVLSATFDANGFRPQGQGAAVADPIIGLKEMMWDKDNRMMPIRAYAAFLIADFPIPEVTQDLLTIYSDASIPKGLRDAVVQALAKRTIGSKYLVKALHMRYDFLEQTQAPPMQVVAPALVNMNDRSAVPGLLTHLMNYETPVEAIREIAFAIDALGDPSVVGTLSQFITLYHADSSFLGHEDALAMAGKGILTHGGQPGEKFVASIRDDFQTLPELKSQLLELLDPEAAAKAEAEAAAQVESAAQAEAAAQAESAANAAATEAANRPRSLSRQVTSDTIVANQQVLKPCVQVALGLRPGLKSIRMKFMITGSTGKASNLQILPSDVPGLQECLSKGLQEIDFPKFKNQRVSALYNITIQGAAAPPGYNAYPSQPTQPSDPDSYGGGFQKPPPAQPQPGQPQPGQPYDPDAF